MNSKTHPTFSQATAPQPPGSAKAAPSTTVRLCDAHGCPCPASSSSNARSWLCTFHTRAEGRDWPAVTERVRRLEWIFPLLAYVESHHFWEPGKEEKAIDTCIKFERNDLAPAESEDFTAYKKRLEAQVYAEIVPAPRPREVPDFPRARQLPDPVKIAEAIAKVVPS